MRCKETLRCLIVVCILAAASMVSSCSQVAITGRKQLAFVPTGLINSMSFSNYRQFITENKVSTDTAKTQMVQRIGTRIRAAVERYCIENYQSELISGFEWEFTLIEDDAVNAFAMPGGKVVVYTGIFKVAKGDTDLAVVVGHEIAHVIARHGNERMSQGLLVDLGGLALSEALAEKPEQTQALFTQSYAIGSELGLLLPYSRVHEKEADRMGLIFMAMAGYEPSAAVSFWERMSASKKDQGYVPEFLSTHPADSTRIANIKGSLPEAQRYYRPQED